MSVTGPVLTSRSARVAGARRLSRRKEREREGRFLVEGPQAVREAVSAGRLAELFVTDAGAASWAAEVAAASSAGVAVRRVDDAALASLAATVTPQGLVGVATAEPARLVDVLARGPRLVALLHEVRDPGNAGTVIRVADAAGADAVLLSPASVDPGNDKVVRASTGSVFHLPVVAGAATTDAVAGLRDAGLRVLAADVSPDAIDLDAAIDQGALAAPTAWVFGNEAHGLPREVLDVVDLVVRVPLHGRAESLNLAAAAAVCLYASAREQRRG